MACFERASPALKEILLKLCRTEKPMEIDHHLYEFGSVEYHVQSSASDPHDTYLSIATPLLSQGVLPSHGLSHYTIEMIKGIVLMFWRLLNLQERDINGAKVIAQICSVQAVILSSQLKEMLQNVNSQDTSQGMYKPIKLVYHPREPFFVIRQPQKITAVFPMRFRENSDVIIATAFFQELMDVGSSEAWAKAPPCTWSPIPPPELRGELFEDLSTNGGFVSFAARQDSVESLNFYACVKYHVKCTRGFIQRRMKNRLESLVEVLQNASMEEEQHIQKVEGCRCVRKLVSLSRSKVLNRRCHFTKKIRSHIKIHGFNRFRQQWLTMPKFSLAKYTKLD
ncbi:hypothetical protein PVL29_006205 [Vitis rotundifolia]|uniref:Arp2/3 complex 34 kDa subunit n=1 Tax=Vitis rotundifolia TaxID=103349 RepID=A0AA39E0M2_VITRO|nr:hypothetical protein PVL29_006205 [Vitis rotundifolia]